MKDKLLKLINALIYVLTYGYLGFRFAQICEESKTSPILMIALAIMFAFLWFFVHVILHEAGHLIAGLCTGYKFISFRIGSFIWVKNSAGKVERKKMKVVGTGGQCLMCPPNVETENCPYMLYHMMGGLANIFVGAIALVSAIVLPGNLVVFCIFEEFGIIGLSIGLINLLPCKINGIQNDGYNLIDLKKNLFARKCMNLVLSLNALITVAETYDELPQKLVQEIKSIDFTQMDISNSSIVNAFHIQACLFFIDGNYEKAFELNQYIANSDDVLQIFKNEAMCECMFFELINGASKEKIKKIYDKKLQSYVKATMVYPSRQRLLYTYSKLYENNNEKANEYKEKLAGMLDTFYVKADVRHEMDVVKKLENTFDTTFSVK